MTSCVTLFREGSFEQAVLFMESKSLLNALEALPQTFDVHKLFIYFYTSQLSTQERETVLPDTHVDSGSEITGLQTANAQSERQKKCTIDQKQCMENSWREVWLFFFQINHSVTQALLMEQSDIPGKSSRLFNLTSCVSKIHRLDADFWAESTVSRKGRVLVTCIQTHWNMLCATAELNLKENCFAVSFPACLHSHPWFHLFTRNSPVSELICKRSTL